MKIRGTFLILAIAALFFSGCAMGRTESSAGAYSTAENSKVILDSSDGVWKEEENPAEGVDQGEKIAYSAFMTIETRDYAKSLEEVEKLLNQYGGIIETQTSRSPGLDTDSINSWTSYQLRIPADRLDDFMKSCQSIGQIVSQSKQAENITRRYNQNQDRIASLQTQEQRLNELAGQAATMEDLIAVEDKLIDVQSELKQLLDYQNNMDFEVDYSRADISINEVGAYSSRSGQSFLSQLKNAFSSAWFNTMQAAKWVIVHIVSIWPLILAAGLIAAAAIIFEQNRKKKNLTPAEKNKRRK